MPGLPHHRNSAALLVNLRHDLRAFDVEHQLLRSAQPFQRIESVQEQQDVAAYDVALFVDGAQSVSVAIETDTQIGFFLFHRRNQILHVRIDCWIRMVVGECAIRFAVERNDFGAGALEQWHRDQAPGSVSAINDDLQLTFWLEAAADVINVILIDLALGNRTAALLEIILLYAPQQSLNSLA